MIDVKKLLIEAKREHDQAPDYVLPVVMDLLTLSAVAGHLQLALRHPGNTGPSAKIVRSLIEQIIERLEHDGFLANAKAIRLGCDPRNDI
jgi:hypothetical protein